MKTIELEYDIVVVGGGTGGPMAAVKAKEKNPKLRVLLVDKANVKRSGAISMGMDGLNNESPRVPWRLFGLSQASTVET